jgi:hypothetical protein
MPHTSNASQYVAYWDHKNEIIPVSMNIFYNTYMSFNDSVTVPISPPSYSHILSNTGYVILMSWMKV